MPARVYVVNPRLFAVAQQERPTTAQHVIQNVCGSKHRKPAARFCGNHAGQIVDQTARLFPFLLDKSRLGQAGNLGFNRRPGWLHARTGLFITADWPEASS